MRTYVIEDDNRKLMDKQEAINWLLNNEGKVLEKMPSGKKESSLHTYKDGLFYRVSRHRKMQIMQLPDGYYAKLITDEE